MLLRSRAMAKSQPQTPLVDIKETCPAFFHGCPYAKDELIKLIENTAMAPQFHSTCPFKDMKSMAGVVAKVAELCNAERNEAAFVQVINAVHAISKELLVSLGECPVFSIECPFKALCTDDKPHLQSIEAFGWEKPKQASLEGIALSKELKSGTKKIHREAERVHFVRDFIKGKVDEKIYRAFVASLYHIYKALEEVCRRCSNHVMFSQIHCPVQLERLESLEMDLCYLYGDDWREEITMSDVVTEYVEHIYRIGEEDPMLLVSHHYTRYLGDLSGGQVLKKAATKACNLPSTGEGVQFYEFNNIESATKFKNVYREKLDSIDVTREETEKLVEEARVAFMFNIKIFKELDVLSGHMEEVLFDQADESPTTAAKSCPFLDSKKKLSEGSDSGTSKCPIAVMKRNMSTLLVLGSAVAFAGLIVACLPTNPSTTTPA